MKLAKMVMPILMRKCREVLNKFISDEKKSGTLPAARSRLAEISFILQQLRYKKIKEKWWLKLKGVGFAS